MLGYVQSLSSFFLIELTFFVTSPQKSVASSEAFDLNASPTLGL